MKRFSAVTFDLWDTLIQEVPRSTAAAAALRIEQIGSFLVSKGIIGKPGDLKPAYKKSADYLEEIWSKELDVPMEEHLMFMLRSVEPRVAERLSSRDIEHISKMYSEVLLHRPPVAFPGAEKVLRSFGAGGYRLGLISNTGRTPGRVLRRLLEELGILEYFHYTAFSDELLVRKPSPVVFNSVLERLGVSSHAAVHIGDNANADIAGSKGVGMMAVQVDLRGCGRSELADGYVTSLDQLPGCVKELEAKL